MAAHPPKPGSAAARWYSAYFQKSVLVTTARAGPGPFPRSPKSTRRRPGLLLVDTPDHARAAALAASRAFPFRRAKHRRHPAQRHHQRPSPGGFVADDTLQAAIDGVRLAARLVDLPPTCSHRRLRRRSPWLAHDVGAEITVIRDAELRAGGFGGLIGVGGAAVHGPALVAMTHRPEGATRHVAWVARASWRQRRAQPEGQGPHAR